MIAICSAFKTALVAIDINGKKVGEGWKSSSLPELQKQLQQMLKNILEEWKKRNLIV